ncbi:hypothetical protein F2P81_001541 [Scophthalmus maximus]|uniref:Uncharacterized protein n=1 Tax=Scophthalmus maximus TaxID=52904 RepID=A0A6A4TSI2_SCOMX|nr:hypothetical protein F2P81_001541 [Scophthalmus maximus]
MFSGFTMRRPAALLSTGGGSSARRLSRLDGRGSMFSVVVLVLGCLLQMKLVTTEGHRVTNRRVFYAVHMDGGIAAARALAQRHGLEFIQQVISSQGTASSMRKARGQELDQRTPVWSTEMMYGCKGHMLAV